MVRLRAEILQRERNAGWLRTELVTMSEFPAHGRLCRVCLVELRPGCRRARLATWSRRARLHAARARRRVAPARRSGQGTSMTPRRKRLLAVLGILAGVGAAAALAMLAFEDNLLYFYNPSQVLGRRRARWPYVPHRRHGHGGQPAAHGRARSQVRFVVTDYRNSDPGALRGPAAGPVSRRPGRDRARPHGRGRRVRRRRGAGEARRELHATGSRGVAARTAAGTEPAE